ncbi:MAG: DegT/DnrJ/EryC1/StrS family aminotransferase [Candidatus Marinimicrobia bacterium]|nr:DegT/DnrJ/EryC1/StrS family aminotransferase [Candidatus Neomarinimicrobiota bacterium]
MGQEEKQLMIDAFDSNWIAPLGPNVDAFEKEFSEYVDISHCHALNSGTSALHLSLRILGISEGDIVFCSSLTFAASANVILYEKAIPVFIDSEEDTWNIDPLALEKAFEYYQDNNTLPKCVIVVNLYGQSADYESINQICDKYNVPIIEDAAESLGAIYKGKQTGSFGKIGIFSFNGNKIITTSSGGMLASDDKDLIDKARFLSAQAKEPVSHYEHIELGYNYRMSNILAAIGRGQLRVLDERVKCKRKIFDNYYRELSSIKGISFIKETKYSQSNKWLTVIRINEEELGTDSAKLIKLLNENNIDARPVWKPMHLQPLYRRSKLFSNFKAPVSDVLFQEGVCLPSGTSMSDDEQMMIIDIIKSEL